MSPMLLLLLGLIGAQPQFGGYRPLSESQFAAAKLRSDPAEGSSAPQDHRVLESALARRGHTGDMTFLQGCGLTDLEADAIALNAELVSRSPDWETYQSAVEAGRTGLLPVDLPTSEPGAADVQAAERADQSARRAFTAPYPGDDLADLVTELRCLTACEVDIRTGDWMQTDDVRALFAETVDRSTLGAFLTLALHMDHLPRLQAEYADVYLRRRADLGLPIEPGLRLQDRSLINLGLPQRYATLILCEDGQPTFAGKVDLAEANRLRERIGLPPENLETRAANGYCGQ